MGVGRGEAVEKVVLSFCRSVSKSARQVRFKVIIESYIYDNYLIMN